SSLSPTANDLRHSTSLRMGAFKPVNLGCSRQRVPDGICIDAEKPVWYGDVPNKRCVRVWKAMRFCRLSISTGDALPACSVDTTRGHGSSCSRVARWKGFRRSHEPERD